MAVAGTVPSESEQYPTTVHVCESGVATLPVGPYPAWPQRMLEGQALHAKTSPPAETRSPSSYRPVTQASGQTPMSASALELGLSVGAHGPQEGVAGVVATN